MRCRPSFMPIKKAAASSPRATTDAGDAESHGYERSARRCCFSRMRERRGLRSRAAGRVLLVQGGRELGARRDIRYWLTSGRRRRRSDRALRPITYCFRRRGAGFCFWGESRPAPGSGRSRVKGLLAGGRLAAFSGERRCARAWCVRGRLSGGRRGKPRSALRARAVSRAGSRGRSRAARAARRGFGRRSRRAIGRA